MELSRYLELPVEEKLQTFISTLSMTNHTPDFFVNWDKVQHNTEESIFELTMMNKLIHSDDIYSQALSLFTANPNLLKIVPVLIASRDEILDIVSIDENNIMNFSRLDFNTINTSRIVEYVDFMKETGLLDFLQTRVHSSLVDYLYGVEAGLDSNARKNRSGHTMESILEKHVNSFANDYGLLWKSQATASFIKDNWQINVPVDKSERRFDVAVYSQERNKVWVIETNYYNGGGSKLKSVAGEFVELHQLIDTSDDNVTFVWVTDGQGWRSAERPMAAAMGHIDNIFNLDMLQRGFLTTLIL